MSASDIITKLKSPHVRDQLQSLSIKHLWLFGSHVKQTSNANSDIDLMYEIDPHMSQSNFGFFTAIGVIKDLLGEDNIDFVSAHHIHPDIESEVLSTKFAIW